jgi:hypothetical protein
MDGIELLRRIRATHEQSSQAAIFTADWNVLSRESELAPLNAVVLSKLCDMFQLETTIACLVGS